MALETGTYIDDLVVTNPTGADDRSTADDHLRLIKSTIKNSFPQIAGEVTATHIEMNILAGVTANSTELNLLDGAVLRHKVISIGDWDMDATVTVAISHGLTAAKIRTVSVSVANDLDTLYYQAGYSSGGAEVDLWVSVITGSEVNLTRRANGNFDNTNFDSTSYNRGWITIQYID